VASFACWTTGPEGVTQAWVYVMGEMVDQEAEPEPEAICYESACVRYGGSLDCKCVKDGLAKDGW
jgi:hypothetical protein